MVVQTETPYLIDRSHRDPGGHFRFVLVAERRLCVVRFHGKGSMEGTYAFRSMLQESVDRLAEGQAILALVDLQDLHGSPMRAQIVLGKWLLAHKTQIERIAVIGAKGWEAKLAKAIFFFARMRAVSFFRTEPEGIAWMGLEPGSAPAF